MNDTGIEFLLRIKIISLSMRINRLICLMGLIGLQPLMEPIKLQKLLKPINPSIGLQKPFHWSAVREWSGQADFSETKSLLDAVCLPE